MNNNKNTPSTEMIILPKGSNPIGTRTITVTSRRAGKTTAAANEAMKEAFKTYIHPGVLQHAAQTETEE